MKLDQASIEALLKTLFASAERLSKERNKWSSLTPIARGVIILMVLGFIITSIYYITMHQIFPLLIMVGICCMVAFFGINTSLSAMSNLIKESQEYQISVNVLLESINAGWTHDQFTLLLGAAVACVRDHCNISAFPEDTWTIGQLKEIDEFGDYFVTANRISNISYVLSKIEQEESDVKKLMEKLAAGQETAQLNSDVNKLIADSIDLLTTHGLYHPDMGPLEAIGKASELLATSRKAPITPEEPHIISTNPEEDLDVRA